MEANESEPIAIKEKEGTKPRKRAPTALKIECGVCLGPAPDHLHFGARCCYSCRAFFRRTTPRSDSLTCRSSLGTCEINKNKKCMSCRYEKCLRIGMAPQLVQGKRNKHTEDHPDVEDHQNDTNTPSVEDELVDSTQVSCPIKTGKVQEPSQQHLPYMSPVLPAHTNYKNIQNRDGQSIKPNTEKQDNTFVSAQHCSLYGRQKSQPLQKDFIQSDTEPLMFPKYRAFPNSMYKTNDVHPVSFSPPFPPQYYPPNESERQSCTKGTDYHKRQRMTRTDQYQQNRYKAQFAGFYSENLFKKEPSDMATMLNNTYHQSKESNESNPAIPEVAYQRTSVIKSMHSLKRKSPDQLQNEAYMLRQQGSILQHTGNLFNYHANLLERERSENKTVICKTESNTEGLKQEVIKEEIVESKIDIRNKINSQNLKNIHLKESGSSKNNLSNELADQMFLEAQDLLLNSPWITNININGEKDLPEKEEEREESNLNPITVPSFAAYNTDVDTITDIQFTSDDLESDINADQSVDNPKTSDYTSVIQNYGEGFTVKK